VDLVPEARQRPGEAGVVDVRAGAVEEVPVEDEDANDRRLEARIQLQPSSCG
jgi:hypothetical protein